MAGSSPAMTMVAKRISDAAIEQLDRHALRCADEADAYARAHRGWLLGELDTLGFELRGDRVDAAHGESEMIEPAIGNCRCPVGAVALRHRRNEDAGAAELEVDARLALLHGADHFGAEHFFEPLRYALRIGGAQVNVVPGDFGHEIFSSLDAFLLSSCAGLTRASMLTCRHISVDAAWIAGSSPAMTDPQTLTFSSATTRPTAARLSMRSLWAV